MAKKANKKKESKPTFKNTVVPRLGRWFLATSLLWLLALIFWQAACKLDSFAETYSVTVYPVLVRTIGGLFSLVPFSMGELLLYSGLLILVLAAIAALIHFGPVTGTVLCLMDLLHFAGVLFLIYTLTCGINYHRLTFSMREDMPVMEVTREDLEEFCEQMVKDVNQAALSMGTDLEGRCRLPENRDELAVEAMTQLGRRYETLGGYYPRPKAIYLSQVFSLQQVTGIYSPFTIEANYNNDVMDFEKIFTMCHELSHLKGFMREDEANFIAWLACYRSQVPELRYSGALEGFIYAGNALYKYDKDRYWEIRNQLCDSAARDLTANREFWAQYQGKPAEIHEKVNDAYLKANNQTDGVESYGHVVDLMLSYYEEKICQSSGSVIE